MRSLGTTLTAEQKAGGVGLYKAAFVSGVTTKTYGVDTSNRCMKISHTESEWSQVADVMVENGDGTLTTLDLTGYVGTISYGFNTSAGDEYSACAPLEVIAQQQTTDFRTGQLLTVFSCAGVFNMMGEDEASEAYTPSSSNTDTVKTILTAIANATMSCFTHCKNYTITFDTEDSLIDSFIPADYFRVGFKESRLSAFKKALGWTGCKARIENTAGTATIHVFNPADGVTHFISGTTYDYEYNDAITNHNFFEKSVRNRLVIPNRVYVISDPDHSPSYTGNATDATSYAALSRYINQYYRLRVTSDAQCTSIATAILQGYQVGQEKGHGNAPMNCGQEVMDYIKITDSAANDTRTGNIGYIKRTVQPDKFDMEFRFGALDMGSIAGILPPTMTKISGVDNTVDNTAVLSAQVDMMSETINQMISLMGTLSRYGNNNETNIQTLFDYINQGKVAKWHVTDQLIIPVV